MNATGGTVVFSAGFGVAFFRCSVFSTGTWGGRCLGPGFTANSLTCNDGWAATESLAGSGFVCCGSNSDWISTFVLLRFICFLVWGARPSAMSCSLDATSSNWMSVKVGFPLGGLPSSLSLHDTTRKSTKSAWESDFCGSCSATLSAPSFSVFAGTSCSSSVTSVMIGCEGGCVSSNTFGSCRGSDEPWTFMVYDRFFMSEGETSVVWPDVTASIVVSNISFTFNFGWTMLL